MRYPALIYASEPTGQPEPQEIEQLITEYNAFGDEARGKGVALSSEALQPTATATAVRVRDGETLVADGPFAKTKEALGGYYLLECADVDEAIVWAAKIPGAKTGLVEVRPVVDFS